MSASPSGWRSPSGWAWSGWSSWKQAQGISQLRPGDLLVLCGVLAAAGYTIVARGLPTDVDPLLLSAWQFAIATALVLPATALTWVTGTESVPTGVPPECWITVVCVGVVGYAGSFVLYNWAIVRVEARAAAIVLNVIPAFGLLWAVAWLGEQLSPARGIGATFD